MFLVTHVKIFGMIPNIVRGNVLTRSLMIIGKILVYEVFVFTELIE